MTRYFATFVGLLLVAASPDARAGTTFNQFVIFGDSLSDTGNVYSVLQQTYLTPPGYTTGRFTDGAKTTPASTNALFNAGATDTVLWHEQLAKVVGIPVATPSLSGGNNYAYGGATTGADTTTVLPFRSVSNMGKQLDDYLAKVSNKASAKALYVLWGGGNDLRNVFYSPNAALPNLKDLTKLKMADVVDAATTAAQNINTQIATLIKDGAKQFLWPNLPPINLTPKFLAVDDMKLGDGTTIGADLMAAVAAFNKAEEDDIKAFGKMPGIKVALMDDNNLFNTIVTNVNKNGNYQGYTNVNSISKGMKVDPDKYLFWDEFHPTVHAEYDLSRLAAQALVAAGLYTTPEPSGLILAVTGAVAVASGRLMMGRSRGRRRGRGRHDPGLPGPRPGSGPRARARP